MVIVAHGVVGLLLVAVACAMILLTAPPYNAKAPAYVAWAIVALGIIAGLTCWAVLG